MAEGYTRQTSFIDGDIILAEHGNLEFNKIVNVFKATGGHKHDSTSGGGDFVPLLKDPSGVQDFTLSNLGVTGSIIKDEDDMLSDSDLHLATQQSIKAYTDAVRLHVDTTRTELDLIDVTNRAELDQADIELQVQLTAFGTSNHSHSWILKSTDFEAAVNIEYQVVATAPVDVTLAPLAAGNGYVIHNSVDSTALVQVLKPTAVLKGPIGDIAIGDDIILDPGDTISIITQTTTILEVA